MRTCSICSPTHKWVPFWEQDLESDLFVSTACNARDMGLIPRLGRSPGGGHGNPLQYSCLENPRGRRSLAGYSSWGQKESDITEHLNTAHRKVGFQNFLFHHFCWCHSEYTFDMKFYKRPDSGFLILKYFNYTKNVLCHFLIFIL